MAAQSAVGCNGWSHPAGQVAGAGALRALKKPGWSRTTPPNDRHQRVPVGENVNLMSSCPWLDSSSVKGRPGPAQAATIRLPLATPHPFGETDPTTGTWGVTT